MAAVGTGKMNKWGFVEMSETVSTISEEIDEQTRFVSEVCHIEKTKSGKLFSSTSRPRRDYMQSIRSRRAALTVVADLPRFVFSPENIDTNLCVHIFHGFFQKPPHRSTALQNQAGRTDSIGCRLSDRSPLSFC